MFKITIPGTNLNISKLIFGTASLIKNIRKKKQIFILNTAIENGFTHFDTAPLYGFGSTESVLGEVLKKNYNLTVTTKVGLYPFYGLNPGHSKIFAIRIFQKLTRKLFPNYSKPFINFNLKQAKKSLENSLKNLRRDCIDIYTLHEPCEKLIDSDEWKIFLEGLVKEGKIKFYGLALNAKNLKTFIQNKQNQLFNILQVQDSTIYKEADILTQNNLPFQITYGYFSTALKNNKKMNYLNCLKEVLMRNKTGSIIISSNNIKHISEISNNIHSLLFEKK
jgi:hypothetical protein